MGDKMGWRFVIMLLTAGAMGEVVVAQSTQLQTRVAEIAETTVRQHNAYLKNTIVTVSANPELTNAFARGLSCTLDVVDVAAGGVREIGADKAIVQTVDHPVAWRLAIESGTLEAFRLRGFEVDDFAQLLRKCRFEISTPEGATVTTRLFVLGALPGLAVSPVDGRDEVRHALAGLLATVKRGCHMADAESELAAESVRGYLGELGPEVIRPRRQGDPWRVSVGVFVGGASQATIRRLTVEVAADGVCKLLKDREVHRFPAEYFEKCPGGCDASS